MGTKHTPGPWVARQIDDFEWSIDKPKLEGNIFGWETMIQCYGIEGLGNEGAEHAKANAYLVAAGPDLFEAQTMGNDLNTPDFLDWIAERLINVHGENPLVDYVRSLRARAKAGRAAIAKALGEQS